MFAAERKVMFLMTVKRTVLRKILQVLILGVAVQGAMDLSQTLRKLQEINVTLLTRLVHLVELEGTMRLILRGERKKNLEKMDLIMDVTMMVTSIETAEIKLMRELKSKMQKVILAVTESRSQDLGPAVQ